ncbi:MAG: PHP domain-containing protein [Gammaproteobacteria bacterium]|nr:PHP domain-containing protein [Gammaproteobacteria bacterium]
MAARDTGGIKGDGVLILDLHTHSIKSDDGRAKVQNYCQWIKSRDIPIDGFVLTEHRQFDNDSDYSDLGKQYGLTILKGSEVETEYGHVLIFGVTEALMGTFDFSSIDLSLAQVVEECEKHGAVPAPCHPGRRRVGMYAHLEEFGVPEGVRIVEVYNGGSRGDEDKVAQAMAEELHYRGFGGSDAHIVSHVGRCATKFPGPVANEQELVEALRAEEFEALTFRDH